MISIVSCPHTGTKFTERLIASLGFDTRCAHFHSDESPQDPHVWRSEGCKIVVPWRDPELSRISSLNRGQEPRPMAEFQALKLWADDPNVCFFDVDASTREERTTETRRLCSFLGVAIPKSVDWSPVNTSEDVTGLKSIYMVRK